MTDAPQGDSLSRISGDARALGEEIANMLEASTFSAEEKVAWASLVPYMGAEELSRLHKILIRNLQGEVLEETEDIMLLLKAAQMKHEFAVTHADHDAERGLKKIEKELEAVQA